MGVLGSVSSVFGRLAKGIGLKKTGSLDALLKEFPQYKRQVQRLKRSQQWSHVASNMRHKFENDKRVILSQQSINDSQLQILLDIIGTKQFNLYNKMLRFAPHIIDFLKRNLQQLNSAQPVLKSISQSQIAIFNSINHVLPQINRNILIQRNLVVNIIAMKKQKNSEGVQSGLKDLRALVAQEISLSKRLKELSDAAVRGEKSTVQNLGTILTSLSQKTASAAVQGYSFAKQHKQLVLFAYLGALALETIVGFSGGNVFDLVQDSLEHVSNVSGEAVKLSKKIT